MMKIIEFAFGPSWKSSLIGLAVGLTTAVVTFAQAQPNPGWYLVALGFTALGRVAKDADKSNASSPTPVSQKVS